MGQAQAKNKNRVKKPRKPKFEAKEEYFIHNGGILLQKQIALNQGRDIGAGQVEVISHKDFKKALKDLDPNLLVNSSAHRNFYATTMGDRNLTFGVPLQREPDPKLIDLTLTEAATLMVMNHDNIVKIHGVCLETCIPILVYPFLANGGLFQYLHGHFASSRRIKWAGRLRIAMEVAYALSYMHNALSKPVVHRDINPLSIILDCSFTAKLTNFGYSVTITPGEKTRHWPVEGTPGYIDPEYIETREVTEKCDVYSFGVFMLELLTRKQPLTMARGGTDLVDVFVSASKKKRMMEMIDSEVLEQASRDEVQRVARLAMTCVAKKGAERPTMIDVVGELWNIRSNGHTRK